MVMMLDDVKPGDVLGRYELLVPVAKGGMAMVWAARLKGTRGFQKIVAIKTMLPSLSDDPNFEQMFLDEATLASRVHHPHVVEVLDLGEQQGVLYIVMEWVDGEPITQLMRAAQKKGGIPAGIAARIVSQACRGVHAAHELHDDEGNPIGVVHRDISPQNVLVTFDGVAKLVDFGVAKAIHRIAAETDVGQVKGKVAYMAPEQLRGDPVDRRADIFALGLLLYLMTTGTHPFKGDDQQATVRNLVSTDEVTSPTKLVKDYPPMLAAVVRQALAKDPDKRFATANDMLKALERALPPAVRATTDEDVARFVRANLDERVQKRKKAIKEAIAVANRRAAGPTHPEDSASFAALVGPDGDNPSQTSSVIGLSPDALMATTASGRSRVQTEGTASRIATTFTMQPGSSTRPLVVIGAIAAGLIALVVAGGFLLRGSKRPEASAPNVAATQAPPPPDSVVALPTPAPVETTKTPETPAETAEPAASAPSSSTQAKSRDRRTTTSTRTSKKKTASPITTPGF